MQLTQKRIRAIGIPAVLLVGMLMVCLYSTINPAHAAWMPKCVIRSITGLQCPGCGSQRALHAILTGQPLEAIQYNFAWLVGIPLVLFCSAAYILRGRYPTLRRIVCSRAFCLAVLSFLLLWTIVRNIIGC